MRLKEGVAGLFLLACCCQCRCGCFMTRVNLGAVLGYCTCPENAGVTESEINLEERAEGEDSALGESGPRPTPLQNHCCAFWKVAQFTSLGLMLRLLLPPPLPTLKWNGVCNHEEVRGPVLIYGENGASIVTRGKPNCRFCFCHSRKQRTSWELVQEQVSL